MVPFSSTSSFSEVTSLVASSSKLFYDLPINRAHREASSTFKQEAPFALFDVVDRLRAFILGQTPLTPPGTFQAFRERFTHIETTIPRYVKGLIEQIDRGEVSTEFGMDQQTAEKIILVLTKTLDSPFMQARLVASQEAKQESTSLNNLLEICRQQVSLYREFIEQDNFAYFSNFLFEKRFRQVGENCLKTLLELGMSLREIGEQIAQKLENSCEKEQIKKAPQRFKQLPAIYWIRAIQSLIHQRYLEACQLQRASWRPEEGTQGLMQLLKQQRCLLAIGSIGSHIFPVRAQVCKQSPLGMRKVVGWPPDTLILKRDFLTYCVLLIGIEEALSPLQRKSNIYFLDPKDADDRVYVISANIFAERTESIYYLSYSN